MTRSTDLEFEKLFYEGIIQEAPDFIQALIQLGEIYTQLGEWQNGLEVDLRLKELRPRDPYVLYNLACSYSLLNQIDLAFNTIREAIVCGYDDFEHLSNDQDLGNLMTDSRFQEYFNDLQKKLDNS
jgi:tetratricopeptide (TPR) repeat protein